MPFLNCRGGVIGLAITGKLKHDGHLARWQEVAGHEIVPAAYKDGRGNEAMTGGTPGLFAILSQDAVSGWPAAFSQARQP